MSCMVARIQAESRMSEERLRAAPSFEQLHADAMRCSAKVVRLPYDYFSPNIARWNAENMVTWKKIRL